MSCELFRWCVTISMAPETRSTVEWKGFIMDDKRTCSICGKEYEGHGHNASPVNDGRCCDKCNEDVVIPRRLADLNKKEPAKTKEKVKSFLNDFFKLKYEMILEAKTEEVNNDDGPSEEFINDLFKRYTRKMHDMAKEKLDAEVLQGILFWYLGVIDDDLDIVIHLYELATGKKASLIGIDIDMLFK